MADDGQLHVIPVPGHGAEDVVVDADGWVWTGTEDGSIFRVRPDGRRIDRVGQTGGRPLGLELLADGRVLVCDAYRGLLALDPETGKCDELATEVAGRRMRCPNNAAVHSNGDIYFSDSSQVYDLHHWQADMAENTATGRLLRLAPDDTVDVLLDGLRFANGVALAADESYVAVAESGGRAVVRRWLAGPRAGRVDRLATDLPGYPDNIARGSDGLVWVTIASPTDPVVEWVMTAPMPVRRAAWRLPERIRPKEKRSVRVMAIDDTGTTRHDRSFAPVGFHLATGVREHDGRVWLGSLQEPAIAWFAAGGGNRPGPG